MARAMKDSGIDWLGDIPADWKVLRNKSCFDCSKEIIGEKSTETKLLSLTTKGIKEKRPEESTGKVPESYDTYQVVIPNDIVMCLFDLDVSAVFSRRSPYYGMISPAYKILKCREAVLPNYADYWFAFIFNGRKFKHYSKNLRYTLTYDEFATLQIPVPPLDEQQRIAAFLDTECARIDSVVEKTRASIEEYKKLKQAVITQAVTKGIRPNRTMKDSGVDWIGEIPADWTVLALKYLCTMQAGKNLVSEQIAEVGKYPVYGGNGQRGFFEDYNCEGKRILVGRQGALCGNVHRVDGKFWATEHAVITDTTRFCCIDFLYYLLIGMNLNQYVSSTAAQPGLAVSTIQNVRTCLSTIDEQKEIAAYLDEKCKAIDNLIAKKETLLTELESYKKSLIFEYVTGKKEVPT